MLAGTKQETDIFCDNRHIISLFDIAREQSLTSQFKVDPIDIFLFSKDLFTQLSEFAIISIEKFDVNSMGFIVSSINANLQNNKPDKILIITRKHLELKKLLSKTILDSENSIFNERIHNRKIIFSERIYTSILREIFI